MVLALKVKIQDAEKVRKELVRNNNYNFDFLIKKENDFIYFPIKNRENIRSIKKRIIKEIVNIDIEKKEQKENHKTLLEKILTKKELEILPRAYEVVGDILILELPDQLKKKEKQIANIFLKTHKNIKTVVKKTDVHSGVFRTRKVKVLAGENKKETTYTESGLRFKVDLEKAYFTSRLSGERLRIAKQVKDEEEVLVMFSGVAPYCSVISKHSKARTIFGIEMNLKAHKLAIENVKLNKLNNVILINGNVNQVLPKFYQKILGLKSSIIPNEMQGRLALEPKIMEIHTFESDLNENLNNLKKTIEELQAKDIEVYVHQPIRKDIPIDVVRMNAGYPIYRIMLKLINKYNVNIIIHISDNAPKDSDKESLIKNIKTFSKYYDKIFFENALLGIFSKKKEIIEIIKKSGMTNFCIDTAHILSRYNAEELASIIREIMSLCKTYVHLSNYKNTDACILDSESDEMLEKVLPLIPKGIVEVRSKDEIKGTEMLSSYRYLNNFKKKFDRIVMPLPKTGEEFLPLALDYVKEKGIIHLYDFLREDEIEDKKKQIIKICEQKGKKCKVLNVVKAGQHAPYVWRVCWDVEVD